MQWTDRQIGRVVEGSYGKEADARVVLDAWRQSGETKLALPDVVLLSLARYARCLGWQIFASP